MLKTRVIPCLLLRNAGLVKTVRFEKPTYIGDPINAVKIFNEKEVDELAFLDITATIEGKALPLQVLEDIASECFMPLAYGGGVKTVTQVKEILGMGVEKIIINSEAAERPEFIREVSDQVGSQSIVVSIDVKRSVFGRYQVFARSGTKGIGRDPVEYAREMERQGAGEILLNSIDRDGTMKGYDTALLKMVSDVVKIPVIACGGAGSVEHLAEAIREGGASAVAAGSMFVFHGKHRAVLINFPPRGQLEALLQ